MSEIVSKNLRGPNINMCFSTLKVKDRVIRENPLECGCQVFTIIEKSYDYLRLKHSLGCSRKAHTIGPYNFYYLFILTICI